MPPSSLQLWSAERAALIERLSPRAFALGVGRRVLCAIHWRSELIVTSAEAIAGAERVTIDTGTAQLDAAVLAADLTTDVAVARAAGLPALPQQGSATEAVAPLRVAEAIAVVGRTRRGVAALWGGVQLAGPAWHSQRGGRIEQRLEFDLNFTPAFEGAAVVHMDGTLAAMVVPGPWRRVLGIPAATIERVVSQVEKAGRLPSPYLGIRLQPLWLDDVTRERLGRRSRSIAAVGGIDPNSPAATADVQLGDLLLSVDQEPAESLTILTRRIAALSPGQIIELEMLRGGRPLKVRLQIGERPRG
jgi:S1-C subfamily serine protease